MVLAAMLLPVTAEGKVPKWVSKKPTAENDTYRYVVESATGNTETAAMNKAMGLVFQNAISSLGLPISSTQIETAIRSGAFESVGTEFKIPVNKVCNYTENLSGGGVRVYVLCQVAVKSDRVQQVRFTEFRDCGEFGGKDVTISGRPDEWGLYDTDEYFSYSAEDDLEKGQDEQEAKRDIEAEVRKSLIRNLNITEETAGGDVVSLIQHRVSYNTKNKIIYAVAFVKRDDVNDVYDAKVREIIDVCFHKMEDVQSYIDDNNMGNASATLDNIKDKVDKDIMPRLNFLRVHSNSRSVNNYIKDVKDLQSQLMEKKTNLRHDAIQSKKDKVQEFARCAERSENEKKLADALRYYYGAQVLLHEMHNADNVEILDNSGKTVKANTYLCEKIKSILLEIKITFDGFIPGNSTEAKLAFIYKGEAVTNLNYTYNDNTGWSDEMPVKDGWTIVSLPMNNRPKNIHVKIEYRYEDEASFDQELQNVITKHRFNYEEEAKHIVEISDKIVSEDMLSSGKSNNSAISSLKSNTDISQNIVADRVTENKHMVQTNDSIRFKTIIDSVCWSINNNQYESIQSLFTVNGCQQLNKLIKYGKAKVITTSSCSFIRIGDDVMCRSIPMSFVFTKGKNTLENVVFTFDATGKIDGIQFALEERAARNIMCKTEYSETAKLALVNFMENYKTAFALMRLDYIESIFADDAVIIVGRVLHNTNNVDINQMKINNVVYTKYTKDAYLKILANHFSTKEWINIKFSNTAVEKSAQGNLYSVQLLQDYSSSNYGDRGYLFLLIDCTDPDKPLIKVRTWQPETLNSMPFSMAEYDELINNNK